MNLVIASQMEDGFNSQLKLHTIAPTIIDVPEQEPWTISRDADMMLVRPSPAWRRLKSLPAPSDWPGRLKWVYSASVGIDFYPRWLLDAPLVTCGRGVASEEVADYVIAAIYLHSKDLERVRARSPHDWKQSPLGRIAGTTLGVVGFGAIGTAVARRAVAIGMQVTAVRRRELPSGVQGVQLLPKLESVVESADHLLLAVPATPLTRSLIDSRVLAAAKPGAHLINVARGSVLAQDELIEALDSGRIGFATLDVTEPEPLPPDHPLWRHEKVRLTPHISSNHSAVRQHLLAKINGDIDRFVRGESPTDIVDALAGY